MTRLGHAPEAEEGGYLMDSPLGLHPLGGFQDKTKRLIQIEVGDCGQGK